MTVYQFDTPSFVRSVLLVVVSFICVVLIVLVDFISKRLVLAYLEPVGTVQVIPNLFSLTYVENRGAAFGILQNKQLFFIIFTIIAIVIMIIYLVKNNSNSKLLNLAIAFIVGGGIGNLIDRIFYGFVVDFLSLSFFSPVCNIADYFVTAGTIMFIIYLFFFSDIFKGSNKLESDKND